MFLSKSGKQSKQSGIELIQSQLGDIETILYDIHLSIVLFPPNARSFDLDNRLKPILDTIQESGVIANDSQVQQLAVYRGQVIPKGAAYCVIRESALIIPNNKVGLSLI